jgi:DNA-3-methyladenine glycosylase
LDREVLPVHFFERPVDQVASALIGCYLASDADSFVSGRIVETEAYGMDEEAFFGRHVRPTASGDVATSKTGSVLLGEKGRAFVYPVFFGNWLLNVVAGQVGFLGCVLLRAVEPVDGVEIMRRRRGTTDADRRLAAGPGRLTACFGIDGGTNGHPLQAAPLTIRHRDLDDSVQPVAGPRIGLKRATDLLLRFVDPTSGSLSRPAPRIADRSDSP